MLQLTIGVFMNGLLRLSQTIVVLTIVNVSVSYLSRKVEDRLKLNEASQKPNQKKRA